MICPKCKSKALIKDTRFRKGHGFVYRRHICPVCGFKFSSRETYAKDYTKPTAYIKGVL